VCPNHAEHTTADTQGRSHPVTRSYTCFHGHCSDWNSEKFLRWVEAEGGPKTGYGLRDDLLAKKMEAALSKITPTEEFPDAAAEVIAQVERRELGRVEKSKWYERFAYVLSDDAYFDLAERHEIARGAFNALYRHVTATASTITDASSHPSALTRTGRRWARACSRASRSPPVSPSLSAVTASCTATVGATRGLQ
jgi:hypothetical protein